MSLKKGKNSSPSNRGVLDRPYCSLSETAFCIVLRVVITNAYDVPANKSSVANENENCLACGVLGELLDELAVGRDGIIEYSLEGTPAEICSHRLELREAILLGYHEVIGRRGLEETHDAWCLA